MDKVPLSTSAPASEAPSQPSLMRPLVTTAVKYFGFKAAELATAPVRSGVNAIPGVGTAVNLLGSMPVIGSLPTLLSKNVKENLWRNFTMAIAAYGASKLLEHVEKAGGKTAKSLFIDALGLAGITDKDTLTTAVHGRIYRVFGDVDAADAAAPVALDSLNPLMIVMEAFQFICTYAIANETLFRSCFDGYVEKALDGSKAWQVFFGVLPGESWAKWGIQGILRFLVRFFVIETFAANTGSKAYTDARGMGAHAERLAGIQTNNELLQGTRMGDFWNKTLPGYAANIILPEQSQINLNERFGPNVGFMAAGTVQYSAHLMQTTLAWEGIKSMVGGGATALGMNTFGLGAGLGVGAVTAAAMYGAMPIGDSVQSGVQSGLATMVIFGNMQTALGVAPQTASALRTMALVSLAIQSPDILKGAMGWMEWYDQRALQGICSEAMKLSIEIQDTNAARYIACDTWPEFIHARQADLWEDSLHQPQDNLPSTELRERYRLPSLKMDFQAFHHDLDIYTRLYNEAAILEGEIKAGTQALVHAQEVLAIYPSKLAACVDMVTNHAESFDEAQTQEAKESLQALEKSLRSASEVEQVVTDELNMLAAQLETKKGQISTLQSQASGTDRPLIAQLRWAEHAQSLANNKLMLLESRHQNICAYYDKLSHYIEDIEQKGAALKYSTVHTEPIVEALRETQQYLYTLKEQLDVTRKQCASDKLGADASCKELKVRCEDEIAAAVASRIDEIENIERSITANELLEKLKMLIALRDDGLIDMDRAQAVQANIQSKIDAFSSKELSAVTHVVNLDNVMPLDGNRAIHEETAQGHIAIHEAMVSRASVEDVLGIASGQVLNAMQESLADSFQKTLPYSELAHIENYNQNNERDVRGYAANRSFFESVKSGAIALTIENQPFEAKDAAGAALGLFASCGRSGLLYQNLANIVTSEAAKSFIENTRQGFIDYNGELYVAYRPERTVVLDGSAQEGQAVSIQGKPHRVLRKMNTLPSGQAQWIVRAENVQDAKRYMKINTEAKPEIKFYVAPGRTPDSIQDIDYTQSVRVHMQVCWPIEGHVRRLGEPLREITRPSSMTAEVVYHANEFVVKTQPETEAVAHAKRSWWASITNTISSVWASSEEQAGSVVARGLQMDYTAAGLVIADELKV